MDTIQQLQNMDLNELYNMNTESARKELIKLKGVGRKVADCILLFAYSKTGVFPTDTWIEKVYRENYNGTLKNREQISKFFTNKFKNNSGYFQQYLFICLKKQNMLLNNCVKKRESSLGNLYGSSKRKIKTKNLKSGFMTMLLRMNMMLC